MTLIMKYIDELIAQAPEDQKGAVALQVVMANGKIYAGSVRKHPEIDGIYLLVTIGEQAGNNGRKRAVAVTIAIMATNVTEAHTTVEVEPNRIIAPMGGGQILPGHAPRE
jgi:hypothetical protein